MKNSLRNFMASLAFIWALVSCTEKPVGPTVCSFGDCPLSNSEILLGSASIERSSIDGKTPSSQVQLTGTGQSNHWHPIVITMEHSEIRGASSSTFQIQSGKFIIEHEGQQVLEGVYTGEAGITNDRLIMTQRWVITEAVPSHQSMSGQEVNVTLEQKDGDSYDLTFDAFFNAPIP